MLISFVHARDIATVAAKILTYDDKRLIQNKGIKIIEDRVKTIIGKQGQIEKVIFENGESVNIKGGFVLPPLIQSSDFAKQLGCEHIH